jgi:PmbA protein
VTTEISIYTVCVSPTLEEIAERTKQNRRLIIADDYELTLQRFRSNMGRFCNGDEVVRVSEESCWMGLRLIHRKRPGRSSGYYNGPESISVLIDAAFESAKRASPDPWFRFPLWKPTRIKSSEGRAESDSNVMKSFFSKPSEAPSFELEEIYESCAIRTLIHRKTEKVMLSSQRDIQAAQLALSHESDVHFRQERAASLTEDQRSLWLDEFLKMAGTDSEAEIYAGTETCPVILGPMASTEILKQLAPWFGADNVQTGRSPVAGMQGQRFFSDAVSIVDDGTLAGGVHTAPFDLEGCLTQRTVLIEKGIVSDFLHDSYTATRDNRVSTGNSIRLPRTHAPSIHSSNLYLDRSNVSFGTLLGSVEKGILIVSLDSMERRPSSAMGEYHINGSGWRIENGRKKHRVMGVRAVVDLKDLLARVVMVGDDLEFFAGAGSPSILCDEVRLGTV